MVAYNVYQQMYVNSAGLYFNKLEVSVYALMVCRSELINVKDQDVFPHVNLVILVPAVQLVVHLDICS